MIDVETIARKWANVYELALPADLEGRLRRGKQPHTHQRPAHTNPTPVRART